MCLGCKVRTPTLSHSEHLTGSCFIWSANVSESTMLCEELGSDLLRYFGILLLGEPQL